MKKFAIVTCVTPNWLPPAAVTLLSCAQHGAEEFADLIILCAGATAGDETNLQSFNSHHGIQIKLLNVVPGDLSGIDSGRLGVGAILRLKLNEFLPHEFKKVLYIDSDVLCMQTLSKLFAMSLDGFAFAAVESTAMMPVINKTAEAHLKSIGMATTAPYFNSGIVLFDWTTILKTDFFKDCLTTLKSRTDWRFHDQDVMNIAALGKWKKLHQKYNVTKKTADYLSIDPVFRHFNGAAKPWNSKSRFGFARYHKYYADSLSGTPWQSFMDQPQKPWSFKDNWRALLRKLSFRKIAKLRHHISLVAEKD